LCIIISNTAINTHTSSTPRFSEMPNTRPMTTPSNALCDSVSPKYAMRCQTTKQPRGPASNATPRPPSSARKTKLSMLHSIMNHVSVQIVRMVVVVRVQSKPFGRLAEQPQKFRMTGDGLRMAGTADMLLQTHNLIGGGHHQM